MCSCISSCSHPQILVGACLTQLTSAQESDCIDAAAMANYTSDLFDGIWYDVAKVKSSCKRYQITQPSIQARAMSLSHPAVNSRMILDPNAAGSADGCQVLLQSH